MRQRVTHVDDSGCETACKCVASDFRDDCFEVAGGRLSLSTRPLKTVSMMHSFSHCTDVAGARITAGCCAPKTTDLPYLTDVRSGRSMKLPAMPAWTEKTGGRP